MAVIFAMITIFLKLPRASKGLVARVAAIVKAMTGNSSFPSPTPALADVTNAVTALSSAMSDAAQHAPGSAQAQKDRHGELVQLAKHLADYVRGIAEKSPANAHQIIASAAMYLGQRVIAVKGDFAIMDGKVSGMVILRARAGKPRPSTHYWQYSTNQKDWVSAPDTDRADTTITGLASGQKYWFRHASMRKNVKSDWSAELALVVR